MALTQPLAGLVTLLVFVAAGLLFWMLARRTSPGPLAIHSAATVQFRSLPRFRTLARRQRRWVTAELACLALAAVAVSVVVARPVAHDSSVRERASRDVVLCLDVSGSMRPVTEAVLTAFKEVASRLEGERISLVLFDSAAVTVFPLTDDPGYVQDVLDATQTEVGSGVVPGTRLGEAGSSLIGDGLVSCVLRFDREDPQRSRTVVLATDNQTSGKQLYSLTQAVDRAIDDDVMVFAIAPADNSILATNELSREAQRTGGRLQSLSSQTELDAMVAAIDATQARAFEGPGRPEADDRSWPAALVAVFSLAGAAYSRMKGAS